MRNIVIVLLILTLFLAACSGSKEETPCKGIADSEGPDKDWALAKCFEETALEKKDILICNYLGNEVVSTQGKTRVYSRTTCRNLINNALAFAEINPQKCELINEDARLYTEEPNIAIKNSEDLKNKCRDMLND